MTSEAATTIPAPTTIAQRRVRTDGWRIACGVSISVILAAYVFVALYNAIYLGLEDAAVFFTQKRLWVRVWLTLYTSVLSTGFALVVGIPAGYALSRFRLPCRTLISTITDLPVMLPPAAAGAFLFGVVRIPPFSTFTELTGIEFSHSFEGVILVQFTVTVAFCARLMKAAFDGVNPRFEQVSRSLGATLPRTFRKVTLPLAKNGIIASTIVVWARAAAEWEGLMLFVGGTTGKTDVLPFAVYLDWNGGMMGWVATFSLICILLAIISMAAVRFIAGRSYVW